MAFRTHHQKWQICTKACMHSCIRELACTTARVHFGTADKSLLLQTAELAGDEWLLLTQGGLLCCPAGNHVYRPMLNVCSTVLMQASLLHVQAVLLMTQAQPPRPLASGAPCSLQGRALLPQLLQVSSHQLICCLPSFSGYLRLDPACLCSVHAAMFGPSSAAASPFHTCKHSRDDSCPTLLSRLWFL